MTQDQKNELEYLIDLLSEASKWKVEDGDDSVRLEIDLRINNILKCEEDQEEPNDSTENEPKTWQDKWKNDKVRVHIDDKVVWKPRAECVKEPRDNSRGGNAWHWVWINPNSTKTEQVEAMWTEYQQV